MHLDAFMPVLHHILLLLQAAISSRCQKVLKHALEAKAGKDAYSSRPHQGENEGHDDKRQKLNSEEESMPATLEAM